MAMLVRQTPTPCCSRVSLREVTGHGDGWECAFRRMVDIVRGAVPHDRAIFGVFSEDKARFRVTLVHPKPEKAWPRRWVDIPSERLSRVTKGPFIDNNWAETIAAFPALVNDPTVQRNLNEGMRAMLAIPVGGEAAPAARYGL